VRGHVVRVVPEAQMVEALVEEAERIMAEGIEARLADADAGAEAEAEATRLALLGEQGSDANDDGVRIAKIREVVVSEGQVKPPNIAG
jgi:(E)-4-hydroxy-3-methylbut-2-enyl-diphosphate synthase